MSGKTLLQLPGIITVLNTPFTADDAIDTEGLRRHVEYALGAGVSGFLCAVITTAIVAAFSWNLVIAASQPLADGAAAAPAGSGQQ